MAQIRSKQIKDFLTTVNWATVSNSAIANASDVKDYVDGEAAIRLQNDNTLQGNIEGVNTALSNEISDTNSEVSRLDGKVDLAQSDIDAILLASDADKDSFKEVVSLINAVDLENDNALANVIFGLDSEISDTNSDFVRVEGLLTAEINDTNSEVSRLDGSLSTEISNTTSDVASIDERLGEVSGDLVDQVSELEDKLSAEISQTNSDFTRVEGLLEDEISETNSEVSRLDGALTSYADAEATKATNLVTLVSTTATNLETEHIAKAIEVKAEEARLRAEAVAAEKLRAEGIEGGLQTALETEISATNSEVTRLDGAITAEVTSIDTRVSEVKSLLVEEIEDTNSEVVRLDGKVDLAQSDIDAILLASDADKDSFKEVVSLINAVDLENDNALAGVIFGIDSEISDTNSDFVRVEGLLTAEINATNSEVVRLDGAISAEFTSIDVRAGVIETGLASEISETNSDFVRVEGLLTAEITATNSEVVRLDGALSDYAAAEVTKASDLATLVSTTATNLETEHAAKAIEVKAEEARLRAEADAILSDAITAEQERAEGVETGHNTRISTLEAAIIEDDQMAVETFAGAGFSYVLANAVQENQASLVDVFVNGHRVFVANVAANNVELANPGYSIDSEDEVVFVYQF